MIKGFQKPVQVIAEEYRFANSRDIGGNTVLFFEFRGKKKEIVSVGLSLPQLMQFSASSQHLFEKLALLGEDVGEISEIAGVEPTIFEIRSVQIADALQLVCEEQGVDMKDLFCRVFQRAMVTPAGGVNSISSQVAAVFKALAAAEAEQEGR